MKRGGMHGVKMVGDCMIKEEENEKKKEKKPVSCWHSFICLYRTIKLWQLKVEKRKKKKTQ